MIKELADRLWGSVVRCIVTRSGATGQLQTTARFDEVDSDVEHMEPYGLSTYIPGGSEGVALSIEADDENRVCVCAAPADKPRPGNPGEVMLYAQHGQQVVLHENGDISLLPGSGGKIKLGDPAASMALALASEVDARLNQLRQAFNSHTHLIPVYTAPTATPAPTPVPSATVPTQATTASSIVDALT